jgi:PAS domain S-box-containing protein
LFSPQNIIDKDGFNKVLIDAWFSMEDECVSVWDAETLSLVYINESGCRIFGYASGEELKRNHIFQCFSGENPDEVLSEKINNALNRNGQWKDNVVFRRNDGSEFLGQVNLVKFSSGGKEYILKRVLDIQDQKNTEANLLRENKKFEALFQYATMAIMVANKAGNIILSNKLALSLFGYTDLEFRELKVEDLIPMRFKENHESHRNKFDQHPQNRTMGVGLDLFAKKKNGDEFPVEISLGHYQTEEGRFVIAFIIDITQRKEIEKAMRHQQQEMERVNEEIEKLNEELEQKVEKRTRQLKETLEILEQSRDDLETALSKEKELSDLKTRFVSMASHEFRTPLSTILSSASLVAKYTQADEQNKRDKHIQRIRSAVSNLTDILNEFLSIGRMEEGKIQANFSIFNIKEQVQLVCNEMQSILKPGQQIRIRHEGNQMVNLDLSLLRNVFINLISNALKFSPENSYIDVETEVNADRISISIRDYGIGISEDDKKHLFERFFRGKNVMNIQGTGLGLHIVSKYVELMNGQIEAQSELEKGTKFIITFAT